MKTIFVILLFGLLVDFPGCEEKEDEPQFDSIGTIIGPDLALCVCCSGWILEIDGDDGEYRFESLPENSDIDLETATFPLAVKFNWHLDRTCGSIDYIIIEEIEEN